MTKEFDLKAVEDVKVGDQLYVDGKWWNVFSIYANEKSEKVYGLQIPQTETSNLDTIWTELPKAVRCKVSPALEAAYMIGIHASLEQRTLIARSLRKVNLIDNFEYDALTFNWGIWPLELDE